MTVAGRHGVLGWAASAHYAPLTGYLAVGPGIVGHTGLNTLLKHLDPLIISLACNLEPLIGSLLGYAAGVVPRPGPWTWAGGGLLMVSTAVVSLASHRREQRERRLELEQAGSTGGGSAADGEQAPLVADAAAAGSAWRSDSAAEGSWGRLPGQQRQREGQGGEPPDQV